MMQNSFQNGLSDNSTRNTDNYKNQHYGTLGEDDLNMAGWGLQGSNAGGYSSGQLANGPGQAAGMNAAKSRSSHRSSTKQEGV